MSLEDKLLEKEKEKEKNKSRGAEFWKPQEGEILEGTVTDLGKTITTFGEKEYIEVETKEGKRYIIWLNSLLKKTIKEEKIKKSDRIGIKFKGMKKTKDGKKTYKNYVVVKDT